MCIYKILNIDNVNVVLDEKTSIMSHTVYLKGMIA